jgi:hypothetical protein
VIHVRLEDARSGVALQVEEYVLLFATIVLGFTATMSFHQALSLRQAIRESVPKSFGDLDQGIRTIAVQACTLTVCTIKYSLLYQGFGRTETYFGAEFGMK